MLAKCLIGWGLFVLTFVYSVFAVAAVVNAYATQGLIAAALTLAIYSAVPSVTVGFVLWVRAHETPH